MDNMFGELSQRDRIIKAKIALKDKHPFFSALALYLEPTEVGDDVTKTICVDESDKLSFNPEFIETLNDNDLMFVLNHEIMHKVLNHHTQRKEIPYLDNIAKDVKVNSLLMNEGFHLSDKHNNWDVDKKSATITLKDKNNKTHSIYIKDLDVLMNSQVYGKIKHIELEDDQKNKDNSGGNGSNGIDDHKGHKSQDETKSSREQRKWNGRIQQAALQSKGELSQSMNRLIKELAEPEVPWEEYLRDKIDGHIITDFTWSKPSKLFYSLGIYLPGYKKEEFKMLVAFDTSCSITKEQYDRAMSEVYGVFDSNQGCKVDLLVGDSELKSHIEVTNANRDDLLTNPMLGGGGTSHRFVMEWIEKNEWDGNLLVCFTDGYSDIPSVWNEYQPEFKTIFVWNKDISSSVRDYGDVVTITE